MTLGQDKRVDQNFDPPLMIWFVLRGTVITKDCGYSFYLILVHGAVA